VSGAVVDGSVVLAVGQARPVNPGEALTYTFQVSASPSFEEVAVQGTGIAANAGSDTTSWGFPGEELVAGQGYWWRARASDAFFDGPWSAPLFLAGPLVDPGDFDGDGRVYFDDFFLFADGFGATVGEPGYRRVLDLSGDGQVEWEDFFLFADLFGAVYRR
jgi:hypothetical protein